MIGRKNEISLIREVITVTNGFFNHIPYTFPADITKQSLDLQFFASCSRRRVAPIVTIMQEDNVSQLTDTALDIIGEAIYQTFHHKWDKQVAVFNLEYNPIYNYSDHYSETTTSGGGETKLQTWEDESSKVRTDALMKELTNNLTKAHSGAFTDQKVRNDNLSQTETRDLSESHTGTTSDESTRTDNLSQSETRNLTDKVVADTENGIYGFNSATAVGDSSTDTNSTTTYSGNQSKNNTGTQKNVSTFTDGRETANTGTVTTENGGTQNITSTVTDTRQIKDTGTATTEDSGTQKFDNASSGNKNESLVRSENGIKEYKHEGNIGNHPTQALISDEIELWRWSFIQEVLNDVKDFLTIPLYF